MITLKLWEKVYRVENLGQTFYETYTYIFK